MRKLLSLFFIVAISLNSLISQETNSEKFTSHGKVFDEVFGNFYYKASSDTSLWGNAEFTKKEKVMLFPGLHFILNLNNLEEDFQNEKRKYNQEETRSTGIVW